VGGHGDGKDAPAAAEVVPRDAVDDRDDRRSGLETKAINSGVYQDEQSNAAQFNRAQAEYGRLFGVECGKIYDDEIRSL
jgi:hypothetical protein